MSKETRYRLLMNGDTLEIGDEMLLDDAETWEVIGAENSIGSRWMIGSTYHGDFVMPARRLIEAEAKEVRGE